MRVGVLPLVLSVAFALAVTSCGSSDPATSGPTTSPTTGAVSTTTTTPVPATVAPTTAPPTTTAPTTSESPPTATLVPPAATIPDLELPGEAFEVAPVEGTVLSVLGVRHDDVLNVRIWPGTDGTIVATLAPTAADFVATGRSRLLPNSVWWEVVTANDVVGWVSSRFTAVTGLAQDTTNEVVADIGLVTGSMEAVGLAVAESQAQGEATQRIEMVVAPAGGDVGEVIFDVAGLGDDAVAGLRLVVFVVGVEGEGLWTLHTVEATAMCQSHRGATPGQLCP